MSSTQQPKALQLAELCDKYRSLEKFGAELRRQHARIAELEAQLFAIGAGGVEPLRKRAAAPQAVHPAVPVGGQSRFKGEQDWGWCSIAHVAMVLATPLEWQNYEVRYVYAHPAEGVPAQAETYAEARECEHCNHVGINDSAEGVATCVACQWIGDSPKEDKCPDCEAEGAMTASCPKCHHEYRLIADATLAATHPTQQGLDAQDAARYRYLRETDRYFSDDKDGAIYVRQVGITSGVITGSTILTDEELDAAIDAALAAQAKQGEQANG